MCVCVASRYSQQPIVDVVGTVFPLVRHKTSPVKLESPPPPPPPPPHLFMFSPAFFLSVCLCLSALAVLFGCFVCLLSSRRLWLLVFMLSDDCKLCADYHLVLHFSLSRFFSVVLSSSSLPLFLSSSLALSRSVSMIWPGAFSVRFVIFI